MLACENIWDSVSYFCWGTIWFASYVHESAHCLNCQVKSLLIGPIRVLRETSDRCIYKARIDALHVFIIYFQLLSCQRWKVLNEYVWVSGQIIQDFFSFILFHIDCHTFLIPIQTHVICAILDFRIFFRLDKGRTPMSNIISFYTLLNLDDISAHFSQHQWCQTSHEYPACIYNPVSFKNQLFLLDLLWKLSFE